ncbi:transcriptional regulator, MerR family [Paenibacillus curdlanolyticus YK9]|uniref:Transcriptional regulator, MerR family n=1 Tax=Paenibacillus curdlanolyticus YK9 TaxID=717606 RepID=E0ID89_9BACL|nr:MerR family transcriptional regulator [Paenibacillus curdlanolyticus]EFM09544.1 transcriptional regulator, MerR family [Paenibacillus curdlanolyticus YK9]
MKERYTVEEVCERFSVTARTLHYYEEIGLLSGVPRTEGGHRFYDDKIMQQLEQIVRMKEVLGISLQEIKVIMALEGRLGEIRSAYSQETEAEEKRKFLDQGEVELQFFLDRIDERLNKLQELRAGFQQRMDRVKQLKSASEQ